MTEVNEDSKTSNGPGCFNWERNHGIKFLLQVLIELGHPLEPEETLFEVLSEVHKKSSAVIISLEDARAINGLYDEVDFLNDRDRLIEIDSRIRAREQRLRKEEDEKRNSDDDLPF